MSDVLDCTGSGESYHCLSRGYCYETEAGNFIEIALQYGCFQVNLLHILLRTAPFPKNTSEGLLLYESKKYVGNIIILL